MVKASDLDRQKYHGVKTTPYQAAIKTMLNMEEGTLSDIRKGAPGAALKRLTLTENMLSVFSNYLVLSGISQSMLKLRNEEALNEARKSLYKAVIYLEEVVSPFLDVPYSDYENKLAEIKIVDARKRYYLVRKTGLAIKLLKNAYGDNTKWRWSFVELEGRHATVTKNMLDLKKAVANTDPASPDYEPVMYHLALIKKLFIEVADRYRGKYELSTNNLEDFRMGIHFLNALRRIHLLLGERDEAEEVKKRADIWSAKLEQDRKKQEEEVKGKRE
ncbi:MAG: hypothetical protein LBQ94_04095 [Treponema sp.]|jgi:hypothetical protein|nr:hypothetical protein [Treponema sp.]